MKAILNGIIWKLGDNIDTDVILPGPYIPLTDPQELAAHALEGLNINFAQKVKPGEIIVAGRNFGCGSSREQAPVALKHSGVAAVVAESFSRIFYRNAISIGLPAITCSGLARELQDKDEITISLTTGEIVHAATGKKWQGDKFPPFLLDMILEGGLVPHLKSMFQNGR